MATTGRGQDQAENEATVDEPSIADQPTTHNGDTPGAPSNGDRPGSNGHEGVTLSAPTRPIRRVLLTRAEPTGEPPPPVPTNGPALAPVEAPITDGAPALPPVLPAPPDTDVAPALPPVLPLPPQAVPRLSPEADRQRRLRLERVWQDEALPKTVLINPGAETTRKRSPLAAFAGSWFWRGRALWFGGIAIAAALFGQRLIVEGRAILPSIHWYAAAIFLMILGWLGTYRNQTFLTGPVPRRAAAGTLPVRVVAPAVPRRRPRLALPAVVPRALAARLGDRWRYLIAFLALALNLYSVNQLRSDYYSTVGGVGWVLSLILLLLAFVGEHRQVTRDLDAGRADDVERRTDWRPSPRVEWTIFLALFVIAFALRLYRLDDWTTGMHGDEGEAGMEAINILEGHPVSPFLTGWFSQPNFYYWGIALTMKVFGTGMGGLRMFATLAGVLMILPFYPMVRHWFGVRTAIIATTFLAISDVAIHFSRQQFSNITTPSLLIFGFFFLFRGLRNMRTIEFILAGYAFMLSLYFYLGGRLTPILVIGVFAYLFLLLPVARLPEVYRAMRGRLPGVGRTQALAQAVAAQLRGITHYSRQIIICTIACLCMVSPWLIYFIDHQAEWNGRSSDKLIFNNADRMAAQYPDATHTPLYIGLRAPRPDDVYPFSPVVFEQTPNSIKLSDDGFWVRVLWNQTTTTLSILTYRFDASSVYTFTQEPVAKPIEAALIILGIAWALWRWRDTRMAVLSMWFWSTVLIGGVLTIDAPYMARLVGVIPTLAVFAAIPLGKISGEFVAVLGQWDWRPQMRRVGQVASGAVVAGILLWLFGQNYSDYYFRYVANWPFTEVTGQAYFVRQMNQRTAAEGRPTPQYYDMGTHMIYWGHGVNRFLNHDTPGRDMVNPSQELPVIDNADRDIVFMVWDNNRQYLNTIKQYYPVGEEERYYHSPNQTANFLFTAYRVKREDIDAQRFLRASYTPANGPTIERNENALGTGANPPANLSYPVQATWTGNLIAPSYGRYPFRLDSTAAGSLVIDGTPVLTGTGGSPVQGDVLLARGPHAVELRGLLPTANAQVQVQWAVGGGSYTAVPRAVLWGGPGRGLLGEVRFNNTVDVLAPEVPTAVGPSDGVYQRRIDGFLGFRATHDILSQGGNIAARWRGTLLVPQAGTYTFETYSNGESVVYIDNQLVVNNRTNPGNPSNASGPIELTSGPHRIEVGYKWGGGTGFMELYWTPPGGERQIIGPQSFQADGGLWPVGSVPDPPAVRLPSELGQPAKAVTPTRILDARSDLKAPRGMALDSEGNLYIADTGHHRVVELSPDGKVIRTLGKEGKGPGEFGTVEDVAIGPDKKIYVLEAPEQVRIQVFNPDGTLDRVIAGQWCSPAGFTVGPDNMIYVADTCSSRISKYSPDGTSLAEFRASEDPTQRFEQPVDVVVAPDGKIYVADLRHRVVELDPTGTIQRTWPTHVGGNLGAGNLALMGNTVYLTDPDQNTVTAIDRVTGRSDQFGQAGNGPGQFSEPTGVAAGPDGQLYVMDSDNGRVEVFPAATTGLGP